MIAITLNGNAREVSAAASVGDVVRELGLTSAQVAVELNGRIVRRQEHETRRVAAGDVFEIVTLVGGG